MKILIIENTTGVLVEHQLEAFTMSNLLILSLLEHMSEKISTIAFILLSLQSSVLNILNKLMDNENV